MYLSGVYWVDLDGGFYDNVFRVYCEMDIDGGGWILVWSYIFIWYQFFDFLSNVVIFRLNWLINVFYKVDVDVLISLLINEEDYNVLNFLFWK